MTTIPLGAINKKTGEYVYPKIANKNDEYYCPDCNKDLIICKGNIRVHHFRHKVDSINPCNHYSNPTESQIHKDAKLLLKSILEKNLNVSFIRKCCHCKNNEEYEIPQLTYTSSIRLEYRFEYNGSKIADVAYIDNGEIISIFEICHTHKTKSENRPEPWFEIDALSLIENVNDINLTEIKIDRQDAGDLARGHESRPLGGAGLGSGAHETRPRRASRASAIACSSRGSAALLPTRALRPRICARSASVSPPQRPCSSRRRASSRQGAMTGHAAQMARMRSTEAAWSSRSRLLARWPGVATNHFSGSVPMQRAESRQVLMRHAPLACRTPMPASPLRPVAARRRFRGSSVPRCG